MGGVYANLAGPGQSEPTVAPKLSAILISTKS